MRTLTLFAALALTAGCQAKHEQHVTATAPATNTATNTAAPAAAPQADGVQTVDLKISGGEYQPASFTVRAGMPVRLNVTRDDKPGCGDTLVIPSQNVSKEIPLNAVTTIEFTPATAGDLEFTCGMNMMRGKIVVQAAGA